MPLTEAFERRFLFVTGKGGSGKTLVSAAAACESARLGQRTLWVEMTERPSGARLFANYQPDYNPTPIAKNLWGMNLRVEPAIEEYLSILFPIPLLSRLIARNSLFQVITAAMPGIDSLIPLGKLWYELGRWEKGRPVWDRIVLDAPATGHALAMLRLPQTVLDLVQSGNLADRTREIDEVLANQELTGILVVTTAEELPIDETVELVNEVHEQTAYRVHSLICNAMCPDIGQAHGHEFEQWLKGHSSLTGDSGTGKIHQAFRDHLSRLEARRRQQLELLPRLSELSVTLHQCPWMPGISDRQRLIRLSHVLQEA
jgi:anion-transporting  ArsA/GET3 family ATPase